MTEYTQDSHCSYCGTPLLAPSHPKRCALCGNTAWKNPIPVVMAILPVIGDNRLGVILVKRSIEPKSGEWALPGGYMDDHEEWKFTCAREVREEIGLDTRQENYHLMDVITAPTTGNLLIVAYYTRSFAPEQVVLVPNSEVSEVKVTYEPIELAFPTHTEMLRKYLKQGTWL